MFLAVNLNDEAGNWLITQILFFFIPPSLLLTHCENFTLYRHVCIVYTVDSSIHGESVKMVTQFLPEEEVGCWLCIFLWTNYGLHIETVCIVNSYCKHELPFPLKALFFYYFSPSHFFKTPNGAQRKNGLSFLVWSMTSFYLHVAFVFRRPRSGNRKHFQRPVK